MVSSPHAYLSYHRAKDLSNPPNDSYNLKFLSRIVTFVPHGQCINQQTLGKSVRCRARNQEEKSNYCGSYDRHGAVGAAVNQFKHILFRFQLNVHISNTSSPSAKINHKHGFSQDYGLNRLGDFLKIILIKSTTLTLEATNIGDLLDFPIGTDFHARR